MSRSSEAQGDHLKLVQKRAEEVNEIWNELIDEHPEFEDDDSPYGSRSALAVHPVLGTGFERHGKTAPGTVDVFDVMKQAEVNFDGPLSPAEKDTIRGLLYEELRSGAQELGEVKEEKAYEDLDYGEWLNDHLESEQRALDAKLDTFSEWREANDYKIRGDSSSAIKNPGAPHPQGGSLQAFLPRLTESGDLGEYRDDDFHRFAILDYAIGSMDRHGGNVLFQESPDNDEEKRPIAIDNGYSMPSSNVATFRSSAVRTWRTYAARSYEDDPVQYRNVPEPLRTETHRRLVSTDWQTFVSRHPSMSRDEASAFLERIEKLTKALETPSGLFDLWEDVDLIP